MTYICRFFIFTIFLSLGLAGLNASTQANEYHVANAKVEQIDSDLTKAMIEYDKVDKEIIDIWSDINALEVKSNAIYADYDKQMLEYDRLLAQTGKANDAYLKIRNSGDFNKIEKALNKYTGLQKKATAKRADTIKLEAKTNNLNTQSNMLYAKLNAVNKKASKIGERIDAFLTKLEKANDVADAAQLSYYDQ